MDKQQKIVEMFDEISGSYDLANRVLSLGIDISWRKIACKKAFEQLSDKKSLKIADVACGTGDMIGFWRKMADENGVAIEKIVGIDPSSGMLKVAREKFSDVEFIKGEGKSLPLENESVDIISISYGIRNVVERQKAIEEFARSLKKGGVLVILEFTKNEKGGVLDHIVSWYTKNILPVIGGIVSKNYKAYKYLPDSIEDFLTTDMLTKELESSGFKSVYIKSYSGNISTLFIVEKS